MVDSIEYRTVVSCAKQLEVSLRSCDRDMVHFLYQEGFIIQEVNDEVLSPRSMWTAHQKAGELVTGIRNKVELSAQSYHTLLKHLQQSGKHHESIVKILDEEYERQQQTISNATASSTKKDDKDDATTVLQAAELIKKAISEATGDNGSISIQGRTLHYEVKGKFRKMKLEFTGKAWDDETMTTVECKRLQSASGARKHALKDLTTELEKLGLL